jgi:antitoxin HigA-1
MVFWRVARRKLDMLHGAHDLMDLAAAQSNRLERLKGLMLPKNRPPTHPGEILFEEFLKPRDMTQSELSERLRIPLQRVNSIVNGKRSVTPETAILLARFFETTAQFWMNLQTQYDLWFAERALGST